VGSNADSGSGGWMYFTNFRGPGRLYPAQGALFSYVKNAGIFECPSAPGRLGDSYAINSRLSTPTGVTGYYSGLSLAALTQPSSTFLLIEEGDQSGSHPDSTDDAYYNVDVNILATRHQGGLNFLYCDGHVKHLKNSAVLYPNPTGASRFEP